MEAVRDPSHKPSPQGARENFSYNIRKGKNDESFKKRRDMMCLLMNEPQGVLSPSRFEQCLLNIKRFADTGEFDRIEPDLNELVQQLKNENCEQVVLQGLFQMCINYSLFGSLIHVIKVVHSESVRQAVHLFYLFAFSSNPTIIDKLIDLNLDTIVVDLLKELAPRGEAENKLALTCFKFLANLHSDYDQQIEHFLDNHMKSLGSVISRFMREEEVFEGILQLLGALFLSTEQNRIKARLYINDTILELCFQMLKISKNKHTLSDAITVIHKLTETVSDEEEQYTYPIFQFIEKIDGFRTAVDTLSDPECPAILQPLILRFFFNASAVNNYPEIQETMLRTPGFADTIVGLFIARFISPSAEIECLQMLCNIFTCCHKEVYERLLFDKHNVVRDAVLTELLNSIDSKKRLNALKVVTSVLENADSSIIRAFTNDDLPAFTNLFMACAQKLTEKEGWDYSGLRVWVRGFDALLDAGEKAKKSVNLVVDSVSNDNDMMDLLELMCTELSDGKHQGIGGDLKNSIRYYFNLEN